MPCLAPIVEALGSLTGTEADEQLLKAHFKAFRATYERASRVLLSDLKGPGTVGTRSVWIATAGGYARARYPYTPGVVTGREAAKRLCGQEQKSGQPKATRAARRMVAEAAARLGSFDEAAEAVRGRGLCMGRSTVRRIALEAGRRTRSAVAAGRPEGLRRARWRAPYWARRVPRTLVVMVDGKAFPCAKADLKGRKGKGGAPAKGRNANVICLGWYEWVDRRGKPIFPPGSIRYEVTGEGGAALGRTVWRLAVQEGVLRARRVQFVTDGEEELEHVYQEHFRALPNCKRTIDTMHACGYVDAIVKALEPDGAKAQKKSRLLRRRLVKAGWDGWLPSLERSFGRDAKERLRGDGRKAWNYLWKRREAMDYDRCARRHLLIGSGMVEAGCKLTVGARLAGPGMHWRFQNGLCIVELRAVLRSGLTISV